jgi:hypothetical protein
MLYFEHFLTPFPFLLVLDTYNNFETMFDTTGWKPKALSYSDVERSPFWDGDKQTIHFRGKQQPKFFCTFLSTLL